MNFNLTLNFHNLHFTPVEMEAHFALSKETQEKISDKLVYRSECFVCTVA